MFAATHFALKYPQNKIQCNSKNTNPYVWAESVVCAEPSMCFHFGSDPIFRLRVNLKHGRRSGVASVISLGWSPACWRQSARNFFLMVPTLQKQYPFNLSSFHVEIIGACIWKAVVATCRFITLIDSVLPYLVPSWDSSSTARKPLDVRALL